MRARWLFFVLAAVVTAMGATAVQAKPAKVRPSPNCAINGITTAQGVISASGSCKLGKQKVAVRWKSQAQAYDAGGYACSAPPVTGKSRLSLRSPANYKVSFTLQTAQKWNGRIVSRERSVNVKFGGEQLMCGKPSVQPLPPTTVCEPGTTPPPTPAPHAVYCGVVYWYPVGGCPDPTTGCVLSHQGSPVASWTSKPTIEGNTVSLGHFVSPVGICHRAAYPYPSQDYWWHAVDFYNWRCGNLVVETDFLAWLVNPQGKTCFLPSNNGDWGEGMMKFQIPVEWGGKLVIMPSLISRSGKVFRSDLRVLAFERSSATFVPLKGTVDGCAQLGLPTQ